MDPICRTVRFVRVVGSPHGHEPLAAGYAITIIAIIDMCVPRTRSAAAIVEAGRNVALARPSKMQLPYHIDADVTSFYCAQGVLLWTGPSSVSWYWMEAKLYSCGKT
jgi:hypothetical protein